MSPSPSCGTVRQAKNLGSFLHASLAQLLHWKSDEQVYKEECSKLPGFSVSFTDPSNNKKASYEDYVKVVFKWYCKILKSLMQCLESKEYMEASRALHATSPRPPCALPRSPISADLRRSPPISADLRGRCGTRCTCSRG